MVDVVVEVVVVVVGGGLWKGGACEERLGCSRSSAAKPNYRVGTTLGALQPKNGGFFFVYSLLACDLCIRSWLDYVQSVSCPVSAQWRLVASAPLPSAQAYPKKM